MYVADLSRPVWLSHPPPWKPLTRQDQLILWTIIALYSLRFALSEAYTTIVVQSGVQMPGNFSIFGGQPSRAKVINRHKFVLYMYVLVKREAADPTVYTVA